MTRPITADDMIFLGLKGTAVALEAATGREIWRTRLKGWDFTSITRDGDRILAGTGGEAFCLDALSGQLLWNNRLTGLGFGIITFANANPSPAAAKHRADESASVAAASTAST